MTAHSELLLFSVQNGCAWNIMLLGCCDSIVWWVWPQRGGGGQLQGWVQVWDSGIEGRKKEAISWRSHLPWLSVGVCAPPSVPTYCDSLTVKVSGNLLHTHKVKECVCWLRWKGKKKTSKWINYVSIQSVGKMSMWSSFMYHLGQYRRVY